MHFGCLLLPCAWLVPARLSLPVFVRRIWDTDSSASLCEQVFLPHTPEGVARHSALVPVFP